MARDIPGSSQKHGRNPSPEPSEGWTCDDWHDWKAVEQHLKMARDHIKEGNGILCRMLSSHLTAACQFLENDNKREQDLKEEIEGRKAAELSLSLKTGQLQKHLQEEKEKKQKLEGKLEVMNMQPPDPPDTA